MLCLENWTNSHESLGIPFAGWLLPFNFLKILPFYKSFYVCSCYGFIYHPQFSCAPLWLAQSFCSSVSLQLTTLILDINVLVNWHSSKQGFRWPETRDHIASSSWTLSGSAGFLFLFLSWPLTRDWLLIGSQAQATSDTHTWGPFLESPETLRATFGCHNSLCISRTERIWVIKLHRRVSFS